MFRQNHLLGSPLVVKNFLDLSRITFLKPELIARWKGPLALGQVSR
jgi:hypothetical protein